MKKERKLRRLDFDLIQAEMSVIDGELLRSVVGGYDNDCFWRCIAFIDSNGSSYSESLAESYAKCYFGPKMDLNKRKEGAGMTNDQMSQYISQNYSSSSEYARQIIQYDPDKIPGKGGSTLHAVVFVSSSTDANGNKTYYVADPQKNEAYYIPAEAVTASFYLGSRIQSSSSGSGSSGSSSASSSASSY